jgi:hypothetical protein
VPRDIQDILHFRSDLPPFLVHLTRDGNLVRDFGPRHQSAADNLRSILDDRALYPGQRPPWVSDARFGRLTVNMRAEEQRRFFHAICFSETPLNEVHCLLEIASREVDQ